MQLPPKVYILSSLRLLL